LHISCFFFSSRRRHTIANRDWSSDVCSSDLFADGAPALSALAHPVRLTLLQAVLAGPHQTAELSALPGLGTSGQVYHHLNQLAAAGWLRSPRRGRWEVPGERTIPLLALVMAATS